MKEAIRSFRITLTTFIIFIIIASIYSFFPSIIEYIDVQFSRWIVNLRVDWLNSFMNIITTLNDGRVTTLLTLIVFIVWYKVFKRPRDAAWYALMVAFGNLLVNPLAKEIFVRARPLEEIRLINATGYSFPSGHSFGAATTFLGLLYLLKVFPIGQRYRKMLMSLVWIIISLVAFSRVYLGVHYLSDVIAGVLLGTSWVYLCIYLYQKLVGRNMKDSNH